ncbi:MAG TPA: insulinase family protein [Candidatus Bacteroides pullicola]|uniref:Insulinase family protein n=1 Tax=Candidatus Bacteroides pullicola TaxID=2838475 RepID=A0A9D2CLN9_9BACE|nr:insulinase family protein [Candidatus Bacteroides pullicola]
MRKLTRTLWLVALILCCSLQQAAAQMQLPPLPVDKNVRIGKLDNGLTYYIRHNEKPENRVEFYIAQKVGSILEEPQQRGLAHFLEHMAFNGTKNFPGDERGLGIVQWCESKGIKFGTNLNAYTAVDETVYNIENVPSTDAAIVDSCLLILHDWSNAILLADKEIDKERGVIREEWRSRNVGMLRLYTDAQATFYPDSKYSDCMPIGSIDVINNFPYQDIRDYYAKWYRPDLQGIIVVGDIDVDQMEQKIKTLFADIQLPENRAERIWYPVPDNEEPIVYIGKDKEIDMPLVDIYFKHDATPDSIKGTVMYLAQNYMLNAISTMLNERFSELAQSANPPFNMAFCSPDGDFFLSGTKKAFNVTAYTKDDGLSNGLKVLLQEVERVRRHGFTESEYARARANILQQLESQYNEREKTNNMAYVNQCLQHFLHAEPMPGIEYEYATLNQLAPNIPVQAINQVAQQLITNNNQAVFIAAPDKEGVVIPTKEEVIADLKAMPTLQVEAYVDKVSNEPLIKEAPQGGKIVSQKDNALFGTTELTLSNGIKVYVKKTDFKADEIRMQGFSLGGTSLFDAADKLNYSTMNGVVDAGGAGNFSNVELTKLLAGKKVSVTATVGSTQENVNGSCSPKDFETMMQLTYLYLTQPRKDEEAFASFKNRLKAQLESAEANPLSAFSDTLSYELQGHNARYLNLKAAMVDQMDYDRILELYKQAFADCGDFQFILVGNAELDSIKPYIETYLGALPATNAKQTYNKANLLTIAKGTKENIFAKEQQTPMATVAMIINGNVEYNLRNYVLLSVLNQALDMVYTEEIREKEGGTYGVSTFGQLGSEQQNAILQIVYQTDPAKFEHLNGIIVSLLDKMAQEGPSAEQMQKIKEYMLKKHADNQKENSYWMNNIKEVLYTGQDMTKDYEALVNGITAQDVAKFATDLLKQGNKLTVVMTVPEK